MVSKKTMAIKLFGDVRHWHQYFDHAMVRKTPNIKLAIAGGGELWSQESGG